VTEPAESAVEGTELAWRERKAARGAVTEGGGRRGAGGCGGGGGRAASASCAAVCAEPNPLGSSRCRSRGGGSERSVGEPGGPGGGESKGVGRGIQLIPDFCAL
jgi:hypothetical protein